MQMSPKNHKSCKFAPGQCKFLQKINNPPNFCNAYASTGLLNTKKQSKYHQNSQIGPGGWGWGLGLGPGVGAWGWAWGWDPGCNEEGGWPGCAVSALLLLWLSSFSRRRFVVVDLPFLHEKSLEK